MFEVRLVKIPSIVDGTEHKTLVVTHGYHCLDCSDCDKAHKCRYAKRSKFHNFSIKFEEFLYKYFKIKLKGFLYVQKKNTWLSGTLKCPHNLPRHYTCWECKHQCGLRECKIPFIERKVLTKEMDPYWNGKGRCGSFKPLPWAYDYNRITGGKS